MSRTPKISKKSKVAKRRGRRPDGTFKKGVNGRRLSKPSPEELKGTTLAEMILSQVSLKRLATSVIRQAYEGDRGALEQVIKVIEYQNETQTKGEPDYKNLTTPQVELLFVLVSLAKGTYVSDKVLLERARALVKELAPQEEPEEESEAERETESPDVTDEDIDEDDEEFTAPAVNPSLVDELGLGPDDPDLLENRRYLQRLKEEQDRVKLYGPQTEELPLLVKPRYVS